MFVLTVLFFVRYVRSDGEAGVSSLRISDEIALLKRRVAVTEDLLEAAAKALQQASIEVCPAVLRISTRHVVKLLHSRVTGVRIAVFCILPCGVPARASCLR